MTGYVKIICVPHHFSLQAYSLTYGFNNCIYKIFFALISGILIIIYIFIYDLGS